MIPLDLYRALMPGKAYERIIGERLAIIMIAQFDIAAAFWDTWAKVYRPSR